MIYTLSVARVIGIIVLVIVIIVVLLLVCPVTYRLDADLDNRRGKLKIYWLFRLLRFRFGIDEELELALAVLFYDFDFLDEERRERRKLRRKRRHKESEEAEEEKEKSTMQRVAQFIRSVPRFFLLVREYEVFNETWPILTLFLFRTLPRNINGHVEFGLRDPARTGEIVGAISAIPVIYRTDLAINPDFETEKTYVNGEVHARGHVMMFHALIFMIRLLRNQKIRAFFGAIRHRR